MSDKSVRLGKVIKSVMRDIAIARVEADYYSQKVSERYRVDLPGFTVPRIDISEVNMDIKFLVDETYEAETEKSDQALVEIHKFLDEFAQEKLLPLWPVFYRLAEQDQTKIQGELNNLLRDNFVIGTSVDSNNRSPISLKDNLNKEISSFFNELSLKKYNPTRKAVTYPLNHHRGGIMANTLDDICLVEYNKDQESPVIINNISSDSPNIRIENIKEESDINNNSGKLPPVYICRSGRQENEQMSALFLYGKYMLKNNTSRKGPALIIFRGEDSMLSYKTYIISSLSHISINNLRSKVAIAPPSKDLTSGKLAFYDASSKQLSVVDYITNRVLCQKEMPKTIRKLGFVKGADYLVLVVDGNGIYSNIRFLSLDPSSLENDNLLPPTSLIEGTLRLYTKCVFAEQDQGEPNFIYGDFHRLYRIPHKNISKHKADTAGFTKYHVDIPKGQGIIRLASSPDSSYVAALCGPRSRGWTNGRGIFYVHIYKADLSKVASYEINPPGIVYLSNMLYLANNDLIVFRGQELYRFPHTFEPPTIKNIDIAIENFASPKVDNTKITNMLVKVEEEQIKASLKEANSLSINFKLKNYKWDKAVEQHSQGGVLIEEEGNN